MKYLPRFLLSDYRQLIEGFESAGFNLKPASCLHDKAPDSVYFRHDIDFSAAASLAMALVEAECEVSSVYYVLLTGPYNALCQGSVSAIKQIISLGHEIGLHYDLKCYPEDSIKAEAKLVQEVAIVEAIYETKVSSIVMHEPFRRGVDLFSGHQKYSNPSDFQKNDTSLCYVSDSCRAWRDRSLMDFVARRSGQNRLLLNTHPESWLANESMHRLTYLEKVLLPEMLKPIEEYFLVDVKAVWKTHVAAINGIGDRDEH